MTVHGCIEIHLRRCEECIIVMEFNVLLITQYLIREILVQAVSDVHTRDAKIKYFFIQILYTGVHATGG